MPNKTLILAAALALAGPWAAAQTAWRCGSSYSQQPCPGGTPVGAADPRTSSEAAAATRAAAVDAQRAEAMEQARLARERDAPKAIVIEPPTPAAAPQVKPARDGTRPKAGKLEQFTAVSPRAAGEKARKPKGKQAR